MPITFACECGKQMLAKDEFAGRRMKCPACQRVVTIPGGAPVVAPHVVEIPAAAPPPSRLPSVVPPLVPAPAGPIRFSCSCGKQLQADATKIGRPLRCPSCGTLVTVPAESEAPAAPARRAAAGAPSDPLVAQRITPWRGEDARLFRPRDWEARDRRREGGLAGLLLLLLVLAAGTAGLLALHGAVWATSDGGKARAAVDWDKFSDLDLIPRDRTGLVSLRLADWWKGQTAREIRDRVPPAAGLGTRLGALTGLPPADVERLTLVGTITLEPKGADPDWMLIVKTTRPYERATVQEALTGEPALPRSKPGEAYPLAAKPKLRAAFLTDTVFVVGTPLSVDQLLRYGPNPEGEGPLRKAIPALQKRNQLVVSAAPPGVLPGHGDNPMRFIGKGPPPRSQQLAKDYAKGKVTGPKLPPDVLPLVDFDDALLTAGSDPDLRVQLRLSYPNPAAARKGAKAVELGLKLVGQAGAGDDAALLKAVRTAQDDKDVVLTFQGSREVLVKAVAAAAPKLEEIDRDLGNLQKARQAPPAGRPPMMPRFAPGGPPGFPPGFRPGGPGNGIPMMPPLRPGKR